MKALGISLNVDPKLLHVRNRFSSAASRDSVYIFICHVIFFLSSNCSNQTDLTGPDTVRRLTAFAGQKVILKVNP